VDLNHCAACQCGGIDQTQMDMPIDDAGHDRPWKLRYPSPLHRRVAERDRPQLAVNLFEDSRSESMADPKIVNGKAHG
jgi:hypothetical protein